MKQRLEEPPSPDDDASSLSLDEYGLEDKRDEFINEADASVNGRDKSSATPLTFDLRNEDSKGLVEKLTE